MDMDLQMRLEQENLVKVVLDKIMDIGVYGKIKGYEERSSMNLYLSFKKLNKNSYGALLNFSHWVDNCRRYYTVDKCIKLAGEICNMINKFIYNYEPLLS